MKLILTCMCFCSWLAGLLATETGAQTKTANPSSAVLGDWHGTSLCLVKPSACHDEEALYHVKPSSDKSKVSVQADKIVEGQPVMMGTGDCSYDAANKMLRCELGKGYIELTLAGDRLEGAMFLTDKTRWREIKLTRVKS